MSLEDLSSNELIDLARTQGPKAALYDTLLADPETRSAMLALQKKKYPNQPIPELDARKEMEVKLAEERAAREKLEERVLQENIERRLEKQREDTKKKHKLSDDDMIAVEKIMTDDKASIPNYDIAARLYKADRAQAVPTPSALQPPIFDMPDKAKWGKGIGNPQELNKIGLKAAYEAVAQFRAGKTE
jgi:hypothetical protein